MCFNKPESVCKCFSNLKTSLKCLQITSNNSKHNNVICTCMLSCLLQPCPSLLRLITDSLGSFVKHAKQRFILNTSQKLPYTIYCWGQYSVFQAC